VNAASEVEAADKMNRNTRSNIDILKSFCLPASRSCRRDAPIRSAGLRFGHVVDQLNSGLKWRDSFRRISSFDRRLSSVPENLIWPFSIT